LGLGGFEVVVLVIQMSRWWPISSSPLMDITTNPTKAANIPFPLVSMGPMSYPVFGLWPMFGLG
jgi:hypothetical protein